MNFTARFSSLLPKGMIAVALLASAGASFAQTAAARSYGVMSLAGNTLAIHSERPTVGTRIKGSSRDVLPVTDTALDMAVLTAANAALLKAAPGAGITLLASQDPGLYAAQNALFEETAAQGENRAYLLSLLKDRGLSHLIIVTKHRASAGFKVVNGKVGNGSLEGLGFFIDDTLTFRDTSNSDSSTGMLTPFAYLKVRMLDAATLKVVAEAELLESSVVTKPTSLDAMQSWLALESQAKVRHLQRLLNKGMATTVPALIAH